jgi:cyclic pyranopterin phosphate synthase
VEPLRLPIVNGTPVRAPASHFGLREEGPASARGLRDRFGRTHSYLRISVTERCNLRCIYCMPEEGVPLLPKDELLTFEELERLAAMFVRLGVTKLRLTGGEPLVRRDVDALIARFGALKRHGLHRLALTSNALLLERRLRTLRDAGVDAVNLSLDTLRPDRFRRMTLRDGCAETIAAIHAAADVFESVKVNAVVLAGYNDDELVDLATAFAKDRPIEVRFIEYMPFGGKDWGEALKMFPAAQIRARLAEKLSLRDLGNDETAHLYEVDGFRGRIGIISSMTEPFCGTCNRIRLTADGHFRWCLLDEGEIDLRGPMRAGATDAELEQIVEQGLGRKEPGHASAEELVRRQREGHARPMVHIGG